MINVLDHLRPGRRGRATRRDHVAAARLNHRVTLGAIAFLFVSEIAVALALSPFAGVVLLVATGAVGFLVHRAEKFAAIDRRRAMEDYADERAAALRTDAETGLANRPMLIDQLTREIARGSRYGYRLTLAVIQVQRLSDLAAAWGDDIARQAMSHISGTLARVTRSSDFVARIDADRFAVVLVQCGAEEARGFADRVELAVGNRPLLAGKNGRLPVYIAVETAVTEFDAHAYRGALEFLSAAGGELAPEGSTTDLDARDRRASKAAAAASPAKGHPLRRQILQDYYPDGEMQDFATAFEKYRSRSAG